MNAMNMQTAQDNFAISANNEMWATVQDAAIF
jgi:hypothetical protein